MPASTARALVVSLHDVSPHTRERCTRIMEELAAIGVPRMSLLVIPNHHRRGHFLDDASFCEWLAGKAREGHEIVTHGYFHQRARRAGESTWKKMITRIYTADEGEFLDLDRAAARELVARGNAELRRAGLDPRGFIAPAWLLGDEGREALRELGVDYTTKLGAVIDLKTNRAWNSQTLVWSVRSAWRRALSLAWNATLFRALAANMLMRISIHPADISHRAIWRQIRRLVARALVDREPLTYEIWIARQRSPSDFNLSPIHAVGAKT